MTSFDAAPTSSGLPHADPYRLVAVVGFAVLISQAIFLAGSFFQGFFITDGLGRGIANDFVNVWAAGRLVLEGHPAAAYDASVHRQMQEAAVGYALATGALYAAAVRGIIGHRSGWLFALGFPGAIWNVTAGQNGFLTAALIGGALAFLERHPMLAGCCLGLLTYKPQFGVLFPLVLAASGRWRAFWSAAGMALALAALSWLAFGSAPWLAMLQSLAAANQLVLTDGGVGWNKLQSVFGLVRALGGSETLAWIVHGTFALGCTLALLVLWRGRAPFELKAAALAVGVVLVTPYVFAYDLVVLAVPMAFLLRVSLAHGFMRFEVAGLVTVGALLLSYITMTTQVGLAASLVLALLIARRIVMTRAVEIRRATSA